MRAMKNMKCKACGRRLRLNEQTVIYPINNPFLAYSRGNMWHDSCYTNQAGPLKEDQ